MEEGRAASRGLFHDGQHSLRDEQTSECRLVFCFPSFPSSVGIVASHTLLARPRA